MYHELKNLQSTQCPPTRLDQHHFIPLCKVFDTHIMHCALCIGGRSAFPVHHCTLHGCSNYFILSSGQIVLVFGLKGPKGKLIHKTRHDYMLLPLNYSRSKKITLTSKAMTTYTLIICDLNYGGNIK